jgi:hypothetical protein
MRPGLLRRVTWFVGLWAAGVATMGLISLLLRFVVA